MPTAAPPKPAEKVTHDNLAAALAGFQADMPTVAKGKKANVPTKTGGSYSYTYAGLADVSEAAMPLLARHGLAFTALPKFEGSAYVLVGRLLHESGEAVEGMLPLFGNSPQEFGSALTYMRRYLLGCLTGIVTDDDTDADAGGRTQWARTRQAAQEPEETWTRERPKRPQEDAWTTPPKPEPRPEPSDEVKEAALSDLIGVVAAFEPGDRRDEAIKATWEDHPDVRDTKFTAIPQAWKDDLGPDAVEWRALTRYARTAAA